MGDHDTPAFLVFQTPPEPTATYQTLESSGSQSISEILPDIKAGPMLRHFRPLKSIELSVSASAERGIAKAATNVK
jgi:hypothetical protein